MNVRTALSLFTATVVLVACGGSDDDRSVGGASTTTTASVPSSALASASAFVAYLAELIAASTDTGEPVSLGDAAFPVDDSGEPAAI